MRRLTTLLLSLGTIAAFAACSGGASTVPAVRDYTSGDSTTHNVHPQSVIKRCAPGDDSCKPTGGGGGGGVIATQECLSAYGCTMELVQDATVPGTFDPSTVTDATSACAAIGESFDSVHNICFILGDSGTAAYGWKFTYYTYGQCSESLTDRHPGYDYVTTPTSQYELWCLAPGTWQQTATAWYNAELTFLAASSTPVSIGIERAVSAGQLFDEAHPTTQSAFTKMDEKFCPSDQKGNYIGLCTASGGAISVGLK